MESIGRHAREGGLVMGICNGFQVLTEAGLLPGALLRNRHLRFICSDAHLRVESTKSPFTNALTEGEIIRLQIAHGEGNYFADEATLDDLEANDQVLFRYADADGRITTEANLNGSSRNIAGICNRERNVLGMMPHPERCAEELVGNTDGLGIFRSIVESFALAS
jgi:phosphoribosylformylglycinamidine synthase